MISQNNHGSVRVHTYWSLSTCVCLPVVSNPGPGDPQLCTVCEIVHLIHLTHLILIIISLRKSSELNWVIH